MTADIQREMEERTKHVCAGCGVVDGCECPIESDDEEEDPRAYLAFLAGVPHEHFDEDEGVEDWDDTEDWYE